jgi:hypothetical protein
LEGGELLVFVFADDEVAGGESVAEGVLRNAGLPFDGIRSGGVLRVGLIGVDLSG